MATANHVLLRRITTTASVTSVTFDSIPQTGYTDLKVVWSARGTDNTSYNYITFNGSSGSGRLLYAETSAPTVASFTQSVIQPISNQTYPSVTASVYANAEMYIPNYTASGVAKSVSVDSVTENGSNSGVLGIHAYVTTTTSPITTITIKEGGQSDTGTFLAGSSFSLYGIADVNTTPTSAPKADGGDIIQTDGTYWYHTFLSSGIFRPQLNLTCDYLVVAGGGGGGGHNAGGGGGGGLRSTVTATGGGGSLESAISVTNNTSYTITVGAGGAGGQDARGTAGGDSTFSTITSIGGAGGGGNNSGQPPLTGGSGGGGSQGTSGSSGTTNQGYAGGGSSGYNAGGGGGGAGAIGSTSTNTNGGAGGNGVAVSISGSSVTYAGGGGGSSYSASQGAAGTGGATAGQYDSASNATANTGGGAGGRNRTGGPAGAGGSGIVIIRYAV